MEIASLPKVATFLWNFAFFSRIGQLTQINLSILQPCPVCDREQEKRTVANYPSGKSAFVASFRDQEILGQSWTDAGTSPSGGKSRRLFLS